MLQNYLKVLWRNTIRNQVFSLVNLLGLSVGMAACLLLLVYVSDELSYDQYHEKGERIYRVTESFKNGEDYTTTAMTPFLIAEYITEELAGVENYFRFDCNMDRMIVETGDKKILEVGNIGFNDSTFFDFFSVELLQGDPIQSLSGPNKIVISQQIAEKYFGNEPALGKTFTLRNPFNDFNFDVEVTGIMENMGHNSHFKRDFLISMSTADIMFGNRANEWGWTSVYSYIMLAPGHDISEVKEALPEIEKKYAPEYFQEWAHFGLQPMQDIHLKSNLKDEMSVNGDITYVYIFIAVAAFIILIASINYMNLSTARAAKRAREVGMRKVMGAQKTQLIFQFLAEALFFTLLSFIIAGFLAEITLPLFNNFSGKQLEINYINSPEYLYWFLGLAICIGLFSGSYPAFILSQFQPVSVLKGNQSTAGKNSLLLRKGLVIFQFAISITLIICTIIIYNQWEFMREKKLGLDTDKIINIPVSNENIRDNYQVFKQDLLGSPGVAEVAAMNKRITNRFSNYRLFNYEGFTETFTMPFGAVDEDFFKVFNIDMVAGKSFTNYAADSAKNIIVNEAAVKMLGKTPEEVLGTRFKFDDKFQPQIIGVAKNFHFESLHNEIIPMWFYHSKNNYGNIAVRIASNQLDEALTNIEKSWKKINTLTPFEFEFMQAEIEQAYRSEQRFFQVFAVFAGLAIIIACLGIFGLAAFTAIQRKKEIGIRKVLGASTTGITLLLSNEFTLLVLLANIFAWPLAWWLMDSWLADFAYHIQISIWVFIGGTVLSLLVALLTVIFQSIKAALSNPVNSLRAN
ncbi:MAG: cell division protein FtsX [Thalassobius sp.]|nr:cell division protein FtsX [Thalassovita sp.]